MQTHCWLINCESFRTWKTLWAFLKRLKSLKWFEICSDLNHEKETFCFPPQLTGFRDHVTSRVYWSMLRGHHIPVPRAETGGFRRSKENISLFCHRADKLPLRKWKLPQVLLTRANFSKFKPGEVSWIKPFQETPIRLLEILAQGYSAAHRKNRPLTTHIHSALPHKTMYVQVRSTLAVFGQMANTSGQKTP